MNRNQRQTLGRRGRDPFDQVSGKVLRGDSEWAQFYALRDDTNHLTAYLLEVIALRVQEGQLTAPQAAEFRRLLGHADAPPKTA